MSVYNFKIQKGLEALEVSSATAATSGYRRLEARTDGWYDIDDTGVATRLAGGSGNIEAGTASGQMAYWDNAASLWKHTETTELIWDDTSKELGINKSSPGGALHAAQITDSVPVAIFEYDGSTATYGAFVLLRNQNGSDSILAHYDNSHATYAGYTTLEGASTNPVAILTNATKQFWIEGDGGIFAQNIAAKSTETNVIYYNTTSKEFVYGTIDVSAILESGTVAGQMLYWNGTKWVHSDDTKMKYDSANYALTFANATANKPSIIITESTAGTYAIKIVNNIAEDAGVGIQFTNTGSNTASIGYTSATMASGEADCLYFNADNRFVFQAGSTPTDDFVVTNSGVGLSNWADDGGTMVSAIEKSVAGGGNGLQNNDTSLATGAAIVAYVSSMGGTQVDAGTANGQMLYWDNGNTKWTYESTSYLYWNISTHGLKLGNAAEITAFETTLSPTSDTKVPTSKAVADYVQTYAATGIDWIESVKDKDLNTPPGTPATGDRYIIGGSPTGAWTGHALDVTEWNGSSWVFWDANEGFAAWVEDEDYVYVFNGTAWVKMLGMSSAINHNDLSNIQGGTTNEYYHLTSAQHTAFHTGSGTNTYVTYWTGSYAQAGSSAFTWASPTLTIGAAGVGTGILAIKGNTSGTVSITTAAAAGTWTMTLPTTGGTSNYALTTNGSGVTSWTQVALGSGTSGRVAYWTTGNALTSNGAFLYASGVMTLGLAATATGKLNLSGTTSGTVGITVNAAAGTWNMTLPSTAGTNGYALTTDGSGNMGWTLFGTSTVSITNNTDNYILTATGSQAINGEANLQFNGTTLALTGSQTISANLQLANSSYLYIGAPGVVGTWRIYVSGEELIIERCTAVTPTYTEAMRLAATA